MADESGHNQNTSGDATLSSGVIVAIVFVILILVGALALVVTFAWRRRLRRQRRWRFTAQASNLQYEPTAFSTGFSGSEMKQAFEKVVALGSNTTLPATAKTTQPRAGLGVMRDSDRDHHALTHACKSLSKGHSDAVAYKNDWNSSGSTVASPSGNRELGHHPMSNASSLDTPRRSYTPNGIAHAWPTMSGGLSGTQPSTYAVQPVGSPPLNISSQPASPVLTDPSFQSVLSMTATEITTTQSQRSAGHVTSNPLRPIPSASLIPPRDDQPTIPGRPQRPPSWLNDLSFGSFRPQTLFVAEQESVPFPRLR
ncbi:hypothetical protein IWQ60_001086 [Tieghemiomyces parasiticus]|uniref:Uncharacterized protein n=1 Tax=Tieghemiomyces parasiticus TaxID=78921 RepID=A0A9W8DWX8_9FUNG|nr:hypothetical protein IWQ60_001086 [Tieghemiomyces parasiticus]